MPKNQFQRPQPINHTRNVPRHGQQQPPQRPSSKTSMQTPPSGLPSLGQLLHTDKHH
ncbi:hypothetical protein DevBK_02135 [Devosia sp. BK]|uniref:hypothetical protein n=1 Tax=Devosia sp. BK TaxID=2871706 RepID=UPI00293A607F|nr:hypothetical protein [Devosia sp. BK]MDV3250124.1 hypothetical protein [Devosia sp. BK]